MVFESEVYNLVKSFMQCLFDETEGDEYKSVNFEFIYKLACKYEQDFEFYDSTNEVLKELVKQYLLNRSYIMADESNVENIFIAPKGKRDYLKL